MMFRALFLLRLGGVGSGAVYVSWWLYPLSFRAAWYIGAALLKVSASDDISARRLLMLSGMFLITLGGWLENLWT